MARGDFETPALIDADVVEKIAQLEKLAPLHNESSLEVLEPARRRFPGVPFYAVFDTAFHRTMPDHAFLYAIPRGIAERHQIRRYGFHGISHRYLLERYAHLAGRKPEDCNIITMHLESGCSVTAVGKGAIRRQYDGPYPFGGAHDGNSLRRCRPFHRCTLLMREEHMTVDEVMTFLNKKCGLLGISEDSLDTRILMKNYESNERARLAMDMFAYRVRKAVGAFVAALGSVDAVVFGGGIAENGVFVRKYVCDGLRGFGLELDGRGE